MAFFTNEEIITNFLTPASGKGISGAKYLSLIALKGKNKSDSWSDVYEKMCRGKENSDGNEVTGRSQTEKWR